MDATPGLLTPADLARVRIPTLAIVADNPPEFWYGTNVNPFLEIRLPTAADDELSDVCEWAGLSGKFPDAPKIVVSYLELIAEQSCRPPNMAPERVHQLTDWYAIAFSSATWPATRGTAGISTATRPDRTPTCASRARRSGAPRRRRFPEIRSRADPAANASRQLDGDASSRAIERATRCLPKSVGAALYIVAL